MPANENPGMTERTEGDEDEFERIRREHALFLESIEVSPVAFALYDSQDRLVIWNNTYETVHAHAFEKLRESPDGMALSGF